MRVIKGIVHILAILVTLFCACIGGLFLSFQLQGLKPYVIVSGSMEPAIQTGSLVFAEPELSDAVKSGDAVAYKLTDGPVVVHRLVEVADDGTYLMKGDANGAADMETVDPSQVIGPVSRVVPKAGYLAQYLMRTDGGIPLPVIFMVLFMVFLHLADAGLAKLLSSMEEKEDSYNTLQKGEYAK